MPVHSEKEFDLFITDLNGNLRGKRMPANSINKVMEEGVKLPRSVIGFDFWGDDVLDNGLVFETGDSDGICMPVHDEPVPVSWAESPRAQILATMFNPDGTPFGADPRQVLAGVVDKFKALGLTPVVATELEFYLMDAKSEETQRPQPPVLVEGHGRRLIETDCYSIDEMDGLSAFFAEVRKVCEEQGVPADTIISELGPGQFEINLEHVDNPMLAGDQAIMFKRLVKGLARKHGHLATFMAKPYAKKSGNGFHVHFSLLNEAGDNVFDNGGEEGTDVLKHAVAGLMHTMADSMLAFAPHMNSYRRFMVGAHAPTCASWGYENRTVAIRIPDSPNVARRIEHRVSGADANPYLVLATILAGALYGIENKLMPPSPITGDAYTEVNPALVLPNKWDDATESFFKSDVLREYLGEEFVRVFTAAKRQEQRKLHEQISDIEYESYLGYL
ncbi:putative homologous to a glutamine synthetase protein [Marinomonas sp. MED121]|uniref:glutamine synthetase family protein n=1 Tax=Marinomonas sp. MED121 TaxID=314277 RepID=UPI0000690D7E|nr:glutamine synthetase family protein [Marinomonas sp. MED121]EAQ65312.1 putative homologous to a glutamine synthetase protein [Marinomonas sp. MED121]